MANQFYADIYALVRLIPSGRVTTYGAIAKALGKPQAARQVGYALNRCPNNVPAQRVVNRIGLLSGKHHFGGNRMQELLEHEGVQIKEDQVVDFDEKFWDPEELIS